MPRKKTTKKKTTKNQPQITQIKDNLNALLPTEIDYSQLNINQIRFIYNYLINGMNATQAYKDAGYKPTTDNTAAVKGYELVRNGKITPIIQAYVKEWILVQKNDVHKRILDVLYAQAFYDPSIFIKPDGSPKFTRWSQIPEQYRVCVKGIETKAYGKDAHIQKTVIQLVDREKSLEKLTKYLELFNNAEKNAMELELSKESKKALQALYEKSGEEIEGG